MNDISNKIYNLMLENNIKEEQIVSYLKNVIDDINISFENINKNMYIYTIINSKNHNVKYIYITLQTLC